MTAFTSPKLTLSTACKLSFPGEIKSVAIAEIANKVSTDFSGFIINQSASKLSSLTGQPTYNANDYLTNKTLAQEFYLPKDFTRNNKMPKITGLHFNINTVTTNFTIDYSLQTYNQLDGWKQIFKGSSVGTTSGPHWETIEFEPFEIDPSYLNQKFRVVVVFDNSVAGSYYSSVSPFSQDNCFLYDYTTGSKVTVSGNDVAMRFRLMGNVVDEGTDILGNSYRSLAYTQEAKNVIDLNTNTWWMSKANPSKYGVESLYFNLGSSGVVSAVFLDPVTPNMNFNVYYSNEDVYDLDGNIDEWDNLLWRRVPKQFKATKRQNYIFPTPIVAKFIKIEFTQLQAQPYLTGDFQKPIIYNKYPQWVFDYFISAYAAARNETYDPFIASQVDVSFDVLELAFSYYENDIIQLSKNPSDIKVVNQDDNTLSQTLKNLLIDNQDGVNSLDMETYAKIKDNFKPFLSHPILKSDFNSSNFALTLINSDSTNYPLEDIPIVSGSTSIVSNHNREHLITEKTFPEMYFFIECRHGYRQAIAKLPEGKAYFAGVKELAFQRQDHKVVSDDNIYIEVAGDTINMETSDFVFNQTVWTSR